MEAAAAMATLPTPSCSSSSSPSSLFLTPNSCFWKAVPRRPSAHRRWRPGGRSPPGGTCPVSSSGLSAARTAARKARLEELDTTNMLLHQRIILLGSPVDDMSADLIISQLLLLDAEDQTKDIKLFINSPGGSITAESDVADASLDQQEVLTSNVTEGMGIYDAMKFCKADVSTVCFGLAASMGAFLLAAGTKGKRFCMPNARIMIHQPSGGAGGKVGDWYRRQHRLHVLHSHAVKVPEPRTTCMGGSSLIVTHMPHELNKVQ